jgi:hypothetical protein
MNGEQYLMRAAVSRFPEFFSGKNTTKCCVRGLAHRYILRFVFVRGSMTVFGVEDQPNDLHVIAFLVLNQRGNLPIKSTTLDKQNNKFNYSDAVSLRV